MRCTHATNAHATNVARGFAKTSHASKVPELRKWAHLAAPSISLSDKEEGGMMPENFAKIMEATWL